jgi:hypothetical protein
LLRQKKVTKEKATLPSPKPPKSESAGRAAQKLGSLLLIFNVSEPQTSTPLIRPADSEFGGAERGKVKPGYLTLVFKSAQTLVY